MKTLFKAAILLVVLAVLVALSLGRIVKTAVEEAGPGLLGATVEMGVVTIAPWSGTAVVRKLAIGNPPGFKGAKAFRVAAVEVKLDMTTIFSDTVVAESVVVREPQLFYEVAQGGSNLSRLQARAEASAARYAGTPAPRGAPGKKRSLLIRKLEITGGRVGLSATVLGAQGLTAPLPDVHLTNVGGPGKTAAETAAEALRAVTGSAQKALANVPGRALDAAAAAWGSLFGPKK